MKKLNNSNLRNEFLKCAKDIICYQRGMFTFDEVFQKMLNLCEGDVDEGFLKDVLINALTHLNKIGIIYHKSGLLYEANEMYCQI